MSNISREYGIIILLDALGTRDRIQDNINLILSDWSAILDRLDQDLRKLENVLSGYGFKTGIRTKDIFDNIQIFYPTDDPTSQYLDLTGSNSLWWTIQHSAELLTKSLINPFIWH